MRRRSIWIVAALALLLAAGAAVAALVVSSGSLKGAGVATYEVKRTRFVRRVRAEGYLKAANATPVTVPVRDSDSGYRVAWMEEDGARVRKGDVIARFDPSELQKTLADSQDDRSSALHQAEGTKARAEAAKDNLTDETRLARKEREHAETFLSQDESIFSRNDIIESSIDKDLAEKKSDHAAKKLEVSGRQSEVEMEIYRLKRSAAELQIQRATAGLSMLDVTAPQDGILVLQRNWRGEAMRVGDQVWPGRTIGDIPELGRTEALVYVLEADGGGLEPGKPAKVVLSARPDLVIEGKIARVDALAKPRFRWVPIQYFETIVSLTPPDGATLKPGQSVSVEILIEDVPDAIAVPRQAIFDKDGAKVVYMEQRGTLAPVEVKVARYGLGAALIEEGLAEGDRIALRDPTLTASQIYSPPQAKGGSPKS